MRSRTLAVTATLALALGLAGCGSGDGASADADDFCGLAQAFTEYEETAGALFAENGPDSGALEDTWNKLSDDFDNFQDAAPVAIKADVVRVNSVVDEFGEILDDVDYDITRLITEAAVDPSVIERLEAFDDKEIQDAGQRVEKFVSDECGVELDG